MKQSISGVSRLRSENVKSVVHTVSSHSPQLNFQSSSSKVSAVRLPFHTYTYYLSVIQAAVMSPQARLGCGSLMSQFTIHILSPDHSELSHLSLEQESNTKQVVSLKLNVC